jgi:hypothetical protein
MTPKQEHMLRALIREAIAASPEYAEKERVREVLQDLIVDKVRQGALNSQDDLDDLVGTFGMAINALKMIPWEVYARMAGKRR